MGTRVRRIESQLVDFVSFVTAQLALEVTAEVKGSTPVLTGWARANWLASIGAPVVDVVGSPGNVSTGAQSRAEIAIATNYKISDGPIYVSNNVPYIAALNAGSSQKAPAGFVEASLVNAVAAINRRRLEG